MPVAPKVNSSRFSTKAEWARAKAEELYAQLRAMKNMPYKSDSDHRRRCEAERNLTREASRYMAMSARYAERGQ